MDMEEAPDGEVVHVVVRVSPRTPPYQLMHTVIGVNLLLLLTLARDLEIWE